MQSDISDLLKQGALLPYTVTVKTTYFVNAADEENALSIATLAALGCDDEIAMNGEVDITDTIIENGHNYTLQHGDK
jgi:hypothetical protein